MDYLSKLLRQLVTFLLHYIDFILFIILVTYKIFLFAVLSETVFVDQGMISYIGLFFSWLFTGDEATLTELREGLVMVSVGAVLVSSFWVLLLPRRARLLSFVGLDALLSFVIFADIVYFRFFEDIISVAVIQQIGQVGALGGSIVDLLSAVDWLFFLDLLIFLPLIIIFFRKIKPSPSSKKKNVARFASSTLIFFIGYVLIAFPIHVFLEKGGDYLFEKRLSNMRVYEVTGLLGFHGYDIYDEFNQSFFGGNEVTKEERQRMEAWFQEHKEKGMQENAFTGMAEGKNVIIVQLEAFEEFLIDTEMNGQPVTPHLNQIKQESMYFPNFYHQTASGRTSDAEFLVNTSLYPTFTGSAYISYSKNTFTAMPQALRDSGYSTNVFHAYKKSFWNRYLMYPSLGIDQFYSLEFFEQEEELGWSIPDENFLMQSLMEMEQLDEPFLSYLITLTSHHPYDMPDEYKALNLAGIDYTEKTFTDYLQSVHYVDQAVGTFVDGLKENGLWENSVVIFFGDHNSALMSAGSDLARFTGANQDEFVYQYVKDKVPLMIHLPKGQAAGIYEQFGGQIDLGPTILDLMGIKQEPDYMMGTSLFQEDEKLVVFRKGSFVTEHVLYDISIDGVFENGTCYDVDTGAVLSLEHCETDYEEAMNQLEISDTILEKDVLRDIQ